MTTSGGTRHEAAGGRPDDQAEREAGQAGQVAQRALQVQVGLSLATRFFDNSFLWQLVSLATYLYVKTLFSSSTGRARRKTA